MQKDQNTEQEGSNTSQTNVKETHTNNKNYLIKHHKVEGSPFTITETEEGFILRAGDYRLTEWLETKEKVENELIFNHWDMITKLVVIIAGNMIDEELRKQKN